MQHQVSESKEFYANNVYFVWNCSVMLCNSLNLPVEIEKEILSLFEVCNSYLLNIGKFEIDTFVIDDDE